MPAGRHQVPSRMMLGAMRAAVFRDAGRIEPAEVDDLVARPGELLVDVAGCGICGSDIASWRSGAYVQPGAVLGHEFAGRAAEGAEQLGLEPGTPLVVRPLIPCGECRGCLRGEWQMCDRFLERGIGYGLPGALADRVRVPWPTVGLSVFPLPREVGIEIGPLVEPLAVGLHGVRRAAIGPTDVVLVMGLGPIGLGVVTLARLHNPAHVIGIDVAEGRREAARRLGADVVVDPAEGVTEAVRRITGPGAFGLGAAADVVLECSGSPVAFGDAVKAVRRGGRIVLLAHSTDPFAVKSGRLVEKELDVLGAFAYRDEFGDVIRLMASGRLEVATMISHRVPLSEVAEAFALQADPTKSLKVVVEPC